MTHFDVWSLPPLVTSSWCMQCEAMKEIAQIELGLMHAIGEGIPADRVEAYKWFSLAAAKDNEFVRGMIETLGRHMSQEQVVEAKRMVMEFQSQ